MKNIEKYTTYSERIGHLQWRIFVRRQEITYSLPIESLGKPNHVQITEFFNRMHKEFFIEAEITEIKYE